MDIVGFQSIELDMGRVKFLNRVEKKYWFHYSQLPQLFEVIHQDYFLLQVGKEQNLKYTSTYFDTPEDTMYIDHHNGRLNRYEIRRRDYTFSGDSYLEVKVKNNKGKTKKKRLLTATQSLHLDARESTFLAKYSPFSSSDLRASLVNEFSRFTLVNKNFRETCNIDFNIRYGVPQKSVSLDGLVVLEIKSEANSPISSLARALRESRIKEAGFSKYSVGRSLTSTHLKRNRFKPQIRRIEKMLEPSNKLYNV
ncbi:polyphosphate polymerase domain-containing protein [Flammeovirgaceae bacterium SG7u.111]|nr:polyphosphate polymerase domain-containing protein [Flammeovirgaceae bacterium SG7u.132]WPO37175.1 polyphosphate polymerase domain-containing protein [Flammeovirgaceae bacterium SG7u.111]